MSDKHIIKMDDSDSEREGAIGSGMSWLFQHKILGSRAAQEAIWWNVALQSSAIKDTEPLIDSYNEKMLIYVELKWWSFFVNKKDLAEKIINVVEQALPSFSFRVVYDKSILIKAKKLLEQIYGQGSIEE